MFRPWVLSVLDGPSWLILLAGNMAETFKNNCIMASRRNGLDRCCVSFREVLGFFFGGVHSTWYPMCKQVGIRGESGLMPSKIFCLFFDHTHIICAYRYVHTLYVRYILLSILVPSWELIYPIKSHF